MPILNLGACEDLTHNQYTSAEYQVAVQGRSPPADVVAKWRKEEFNAAVASWDAWLCWRTYRYFKFDLPGELKTVEADTLSLQAERAAAKVSLDIYSSIIRDFQDDLSAADREFLQYYFVEWRTLKSEADVARASEILTRIGYGREAPAALQENIKKVYVAAGGKEENFHAPEMTSMNPIVLAGLIGVAYLLFKRS